MTPAEPDEEASRVYSLRITPLAQTDIAAAHAHFTDLAGQSIADEWRAGLLVAIGTLARLPGRQARAPESRYFRQELRQLVYRRRPGSAAYRVLFTLRGEAGESPSVLILHVRHGAQKPITRTEARTIEKGE